MQHSPRTSRPPNRPVRSAAPTGSARPPSRLLLGAAGALLLHTIACGAPPSTLPTDASSGDAGPRSDARAVPCAEHAFSAQGTFRVFAVQLRADFARVATYEDFRAAVLGEIERSVRPCLATDRPNVIVFPETLSVLAMGIGSRATLARRQKSTVGAALLLLSTYERALAHYEAQWADLGLGEKLQLALTDTVWRAVYETSREVARSTGAWVVTTADVAGTVERSEAPGELAALADPDLASPGYVYVARERQIYNKALVLSPMGEIVADYRKAYLVSAEESPLELRWGPVAGAEPIDLGFARLGLLVCKDAFMADLPDRLDILGAEVLVQPVAFEGWAVPECPNPPCGFEGSVDPADAWRPDTLRGSAWNAVQRLDGLRYGVMPLWTGNVMERILDGQSSIVGDALPGSRRWAYIGQDPAAGFLAVAPWVAPDPGRADPSLSLDERRRRLRAVGETLVPGGAKENAYVQTVVAADAELGRFPQAPHGPPGALGPSRELAPTAVGEQRFPAVASDGQERVALAWQDARDGRAQTYLSVSRDGGQTFSAARAVAPGPERQHTPAVAWQGEALYVAWQSVSGRDRRIRAVRSLDGGASFAALALPEPAAPADDWTPALASSATHLYLAYVGGQQGNARVRVARVPSGGDTFTTVNADGAPPARPAPDPRNNHWAPAIVASGRTVAVAWVGYRNYNWDLFLSRSEDDGASFSAATRIDDAGATMLERKHNDPALALLEDGTLVAAWADRRRREARASVRVARGAPSFGASQELARGGAGSSAWRPRLTSLGPRTVLAIWQDFRADGNDLYLAKSVDGGESFAPEQRVDDGGDGPSYQFTPVVAPLAKGRALVAWIDTRSGQRRVRIAVGAP
ncbi:MAG: hypothetical protein IT371_14680 [Deltaproteobacteria bacterium]|nr:hypothetical protein [Deltaproteobacteria bacterium]